MDIQIKQQLEDELEQIRNDGMYKSERIIESPQGVEILVNQKKVLNFCSNNYLGLSNDSQVILDAKAGLDRWGYGLSSVRFICGTQEVHKNLETTITNFLGTEDTILYSSCFDANGGLFEALAQEADVIISDRLNHASIIDGVRLSKAQRLVYEHMDANDLASQLQSVKGSRRKIVVTDGVFSMDGDIAPLKEIVEVSEQFGAIVVVDDSHAAGFVGPRGRGTPEYHNVQQRVDLITGTLGKALGGASGGFTSGRKEIIEYLRQRSRPYLFSNSIPPFIAATSLAILTRLMSDDSAQQALWENTKYFRDGIEKIGLTVRPGIHPIVPIMIGDAIKSQNMAARLLELGIFVISFSFPVVPKGTARIRVQLSSGHTRAHLDHALEAFKQAAQEVGIVAK